MEIVGRLLSRSSLFKLLLVLAALIPPLPALATWSRFLGFQSPRSPAFFAFLYICRIIVNVVQVFGWDITDHRLVFLIVLSLWLYDRWQEQPEPEPELMAIICYIIFFQPRIWLFLTLCDNVWHNSFSKKQNILCVGIIYGILWIIIGIYCISFFCLHREIPMDLISAKVWLSFVKIYPFLKILAKTLDYRNIHLLEVKNICNIRSISLIKLCLKP